MPQAKAKQARRPDGVYRTRAQAEAAGLAFADRCAAEGWRREAFVGKYVDTGGVEDYEHAGPSVRLTSPGGLEQLIFRVGDARESWLAGRRVGWEVTASGTTAFRDEGGGWRTFDRRGVDDSFYVDAGELAALDVAAFAAGQVERCAAARLRAARSSPVPGLPYSVTPERREELAAALRAGRPARLAPAGMGTGHCLTVRRPPGRYGVQRLPAAAAFFGVPDLWSETFDHD